MIRKGAGVPDSRTHRGPDPRDAQAFGPSALSALRAAVADLSWLLERGYAIVSAVKLVGDRWSLTERQRWPCDEPPAPTPPARQGFLDAWPRRVSAAAFYSSTASMS